MSRKINRKCQKCAALRHIDAQKRGCWAGQRCVSKRSYYRNRAGRVAAKAAKNERDRAEPAGVDLPLQSYEAPPIAQVVYWRKAEAKPVHAVAIRVYQDGKLIDQARPKHCQGMPANQLKRNLREWAGVLRARNAGLKGGADIQIAPELCPLCKQKNSEDL